MKVAVVGGGKIGLPLAAQFAANGADVTVCDINPQVVDTINAGRSPFDEPHLATYVSRAVAAERLRACGDTTLAVAGAEVVVVIVPAMLTPERAIDYRNLQTATRAIAGGLRRGTLVSFETTVPVGGCRNVLVPLLEASGLKAGEDFLVCFSPERVKSRRIFERLSKTPKVVGGYDAASTVRGAEFYSRYLGAKVLNVGTLEAAEFTKLAGMLYRDVNIALANQLANFAEAAGLDASAVFAAANTDDETFLLQPGIGVGGHCTPVYPYFLIAAAQQLGRPQSMAELARSINEAQPVRQIERLEGAIDGLNGRSVHILGLAFRPEVREHSYSPTFALRDALLERGAVVTVEDPLYGSDELQSLGFRPGRAGLDRPMDAVILTTGHAAFEQPDFDAWRHCGVRAVLDGRSVWSRATVEAAGLSYLAVGVGNATA